MNKSWEIVIGLEVHTQLSTSSKIFSGASTTYGAEPNTQADAVSIALPGVLPVLNKGAVERAIKFGLAVGAHIAPRSVFARKNYFYPDLPKGYQISQFDLPVVGQGALTIQVEPLSGNAKPYEKVVRITRAHLEEDAGKSTHGVGGAGAGGYAIAGAYGRGNVTGIDLNRAGTPLLEIVSEPDMSSAAEAVAYAKTLHSLVRWIGICDGNMQEGSFRCDVNVSVRRPGEPLGTRREIKNLNSFIFMQQAIDYEVQWQIDTLENGGIIQQATILFDPDSGETRMMRSKEDAHDYRYFPDPDLLPLEITEADIEKIRNEMSFSESSFIERFKKQEAIEKLQRDADLDASMEVTIRKTLRKIKLRDGYGLSNEAANAMAATLDTAEYFVECIEEGADATMTANWIIGEVSAQLNREGLSMAQCPITPQQLGGILKRIKDGTISNSAAKDVFRTMWNEGGYADAIIEAKGLKQVSNIGTIENIVDEIIAANPAQVAEYRGGKDKVFGFFVGLAMKASKGKANPAQLNEALKRKLEG
jgi:aspartyl-tRNA(Asn)/glutamyl-tRNA(Gln) amidotransferase subunit B